MLENVKLFIKVEDGHETPNLVALLYFGFIKRQVNEPLVFFTIHTKYFQLLPCCKRVVPIKLEIATLS